MGEPMKPYEPCGYEGRNVRISSDEPLMNLCSLPGTKTAQSSYYDKKIVILRAMLLMVIQKRSHIQEEVLNNGLK